MAAGGHRIDPETGEPYRLGGCLISGEASDLPKFGAPRFLANKDLPASVDLRVYMTPIENQGKSNAWLVSRRFLIRV